MARSQLWPDPTQPWNSTWLSDWRTAGYGGGLPIPDRPTTISFPAGRHTITNQLLLQSGNVLRGFGMGQTVLYFPNPLSVMLNNPVPPSGNSPYSWQDGCIQVSGKSEVGIEDLTIEFPLTQYPGHFREQGYNGIAFKGCTDCWVRNVEIIHADSGLFIERGSSRVTAQGIRIRSTRSGGDGKQGHHGIELQRVTACVVHDFEIRQQFHHPITFEDASDCVFSGGRGDDMNADHHKSTLGRNIVRCLVTDCDLGSGGRHPFESSGNPSYPETGASKNAYWGNRKNGQPFSVTPPWQTSGLVIVSFASTQIDSSKHLERVDTLEPQNLWLAQRGEETPASTPTPPEPPPPQGGAMEQSIPGPGTYTVDIPATDDYLIELEVIAPSLGSNSFFVSVDGQNREACHLGVSSVWQWNPVTYPSVDQPGTGGLIKLWSMTTGTHSLTIEPRESGTQVRAFRITANSGHSVEDQIRTSLKQSAPYGLSWTDAMVDRVLNVVVNP